MSEDVPAAIAAVVDRIAAPAAATAPLPVDVTGALADLLRWWHSVSAPVGLVPVELSADTPADAGPADAELAITSGITAADRAINAGATLLVPRVRVRDEVAARTIIALLTRKEASAIVAQPDGTTDREWIAACAAVRDRAAEAAAHRGEPIALLGALAAPGIARVVGVLLGAAARRTPCLVDGTDELAAALVADRICFRGKGWWRASSDSPDPGRTAAIDRADLVAGLPLGLADDAGRGAEATLALLERLVPPVAT